LGGKNHGGTNMQRNENPQILNAEQMSLLLNISEKTVKHLAKAGELPCAFVNRRPQFKWNDLVKHFQELEGGAA